MKLSPLFLALLLATGCASPSKSAQKAVAKTAALRDESARIDSELQDKGKALVYGTGVALSLAPPSPAVTVAYDLNRQAGAILGPPSYAEAETFTRIVQGTLSEDSVQKKSAEKEKATFDRSVATLQTQSDKLETAVMKSEVAKDKLLLANSAVAQTWIDLKHWVYWIAGILVGLWFLPKLLRLAMLAIPALGPIAVPASNLVARMVSHAVDNVPGVARKAGVVVKEVYDTTEAAANKAVATIEALKATPEIREEVKTVLKTIPAAPVPVEQEITRLRT